MRRRGLSDPLLVISDGAPGLIRAIEECFPRSARQRCLAGSSTSAWNLFGRLEIEVDEGRDGLRMRKHLAKVRAAWLPMRRIILSPQWHFRRDGSNLRRNRA